MSSIVGVVWGTERRRVATVIAIFVALALTATVGVSLTNEIAHNKALSLAKSAHASASSAEATFRALTEVVAPATKARAVAFQQDAAPLAESLTGLVDADALAQLRERLGVLDGALRRAQLWPEFDLARSGATPTEATSTTTLQERREKLLAATTEYRAAVAQLGPRVDALASALTAAEEALRVVAASVPAWAAAAVGMASRASDGTKAAVTQAAQAAADATSPDLVRHLIEYAAAITALRDSHDASTGVAIP